MNEVSGPASRYISATIEPYRYGSAPRRVRSNSVRCQCRNALPVYHLDGVGGVRRRSQLDLIAEHGEVTRPARNVGGAEAIFVNLRAGLEFKPRLACHARQANPAHRLEICRQRNVFWLARSGID